MFNLRPYQDEADEQIKDSLRAGNRAVVLVAATGYGKTVQAAAIIRSAMKKGNNVLFLTPRRNLVEQTIKSFRSKGIECGYVMAGHKYDKDHRVQVGSIDTLLSRLGNREYDEMVFYSDIIIADEYHTFSSETRAKFINEIRSGSCGKKIIIGLTATPATTGGGGLAHIADDLVIPITMRELISQRYLLQPKYFAAEMPDLSNIKSGKDDYNAKDLGGAYQTAKIMGSVVENYKRIAPNTSAVVFAPTRKNAAALVDEFNNAGFPAAYLDANTPDDERHEVFRKIESGELLIICNVLIIGMGTDIPRLQTVCFATSTKSIVRWCQGVGRVLRPYEGQEFAYVIDHGGMCLNPEMGAVEYIDQWELTDPRSINERIQQAKQDAKEPVNIECSQCHVIYLAAHSCPSCGHTRKMKGEKLEYHKADLQEVKTKENAAGKRNRIMTKEAKANIYGQFLQYVAERSGNPGRAAHLYKAYFGVWPNAHKETKPAGTITPEINAYIKHLAIKYARGKAKSNS